MLSDSEQRRLDHITRQLAESDPDFVAWMRVPQADGVGRAERWARRGYALVIALSLLSALICLVLSHDGGGSASVPALALAAATYFLRRRRFRPSREPSAEIER